jgi:hypothetical protein
VKAPSTEHLEEHRVLASRPRHPDAQIGLVLGQPQHLCRVNKHRRSVADKESTVLYLADVRDKVGFDAT